MALKIWNKFDRNVILKNKIVILKQELFVKNLIFITIKNKMKEYIVYCKLLKN